MILHKTRPIATAIAVPPKKKFLIVFPPIFPNVFKILYICCRTYQKSQHQWCNYHSQQTGQYSSKKCQLCCFLSKISPAAIPRTNPTIILVNNPNWFHFLLDSYVCPPFLYKSAYMVYRNIRNPYASAFVSFPLQT